MNVLLSGSTGLIGSALEPALRGEGFGVVPLVRRSRQWDREVRWDPQSYYIDPAQLDHHQIDAVVHLAGAGVADGRWTEQRKRLIHDSRSRGTRQVVQAMLAAERRPGVLLCASAIGFYGDRGDEVLDESSAMGKGFLADVCRDWEGVTELARRNGVRVVNLRFGVVLSRNGGALARMLPIFRLGLGGTIGGGGQWVSWVSIDDAVGAVLHALRDGSINGPVNVVAPNPVTNRELARTLGRAVRRPAALPAPAWALRARFGDMAREALLSSQRVRPGVLEATGYAFRHPTLEAALSAALARRR